MAFKIQQPKIILQPGTIVRKRQYFDHSLPPRIGEIVGQAERGGKNWYYPIRWRKSQRVEKVMIQRVEPLE